MTFYENLISRVGLIIVAIYLHTTENRCKLSPRIEYGNWSHEETRDMYRVHICRKVDLGEKEKNALGKLRNDFWLLLINRRNADYGIDRNIDDSLARTLWRNSNRLITLLQNLIERGVL